MRSIVCQGPAVLRLPAWGVLVLLVLGLIAPGGSFATTLYRWVDSDGVVHYSDTPHPGAEQIQISGAQTYHGTTPPPAATPAASAAAQSKTAQAYQSCAIAQPAPDTALFAPESVDISVRLDPPLRPGDQLTVRVDGQTLQPLGDSLNFQLAQPDRGEHTVSAEVRGSDGTVVCSATAVSFSVQRPSMDMPQSPVKPH
jgi:hypothetical protein